MDYKNGRIFLQWNDFQENASSSIWKMRDDQVFADVTLACEENQQFEAHKVIMANSSNWFCNLLKKNKHPHPLIYLRGVKGRHMVSILDFIYQGEVNIPQEELEDFMHLGWELGIKGLKTTQESKVDDIKATSNMKEDKNTAQEVVIQLKPELEHFSKTELEENMSINMSKLSDMREVVHYPITSGEMVLDPFVEEQEALEVVQDMEDVKEVEAVQETETTRTEQGQVIS